MTDLLSALDDGPEKAPSPALLVALLNDPGNPLRLITDAAPLLISYVDAGYRYRYANQAYADWFSLPLDRVVGREIREVIGEAAFAHIKPYLDRALQGERVTYETAMPYARGGPRYVHTHVAPDIGPDGQTRGFVGVITDITGRRRAEEKLERREREYAALVEGSPDIISRFTRDLRLTYTSPAVQRFTGMPPEFFVGKTHAEMGMPPEMYRIADACLERIFATGRAESITFSIPDPDGTLTHFEARGVPLFAADGTVESVMTISRDVTARRNAEEENAALLRDRAETALRQRGLLREMLFSVSEGRFSLCDEPEALPPLLPAIGEPVTLTLETLRVLRGRLAEAARGAGFSQERVHDVVTAAGEASMNAVAHAGGGTGSIHLAADGSVAQVRIADTGSGIAVHDLHKTFRRGYSSAGTLGHGFYLMLQTADRVHLLTRPGGTTVVIEKERTAPEPLWLRERR
jgi:PAS domain S-box-containing protein